MNILIAPLNWGLGHATRCIPLIRKFQKEGHRVTIVAEGFPARLLSEEFPELNLLELPSYSIGYSAGRSQVGAMLKSLPAIFTGIVNEHRWLNKLIRREQVDMIVSDNRFGMWNRKIRSVYISHQLMIKMPTALKWLEPVAWLVHRWFIHQYHECWIPDYQIEPSLSGDLSHRYPLPRNARFIGPLSRFTKKEQANSEFKTVILISGPEPQRTLFEQEQTALAALYPAPVLMIRGLPGTTKSTTKEELTIIPHLATSLLASYLTGAETIICRSGYSTLMDLEALGCLEKAVLHPTPGQTEQEYLAEYHKKTVSR